MVKDTSRKMWLILLVCMAVLVGVVNSEEQGQDVQMDKRCNRQIPEDRIVDVGGECRTSRNCQQLDTNCVHVRDNYCQCQVAEERMKKKRGKKFCKKNKGYSCSRKSKCQKKYRKRGKTCLHPAHVCCTQCKNLEGFSCVPKKECIKGSLKIWYQCPKKSTACCKPECQSGALDEYCQAGRCECSVTKGECSGETCQCIWGSTAVDGTCQCKQGWTEVDGACEPVVPAGYAKMDGLPCYLKLSEQAKSWEDGRLDCQDDDPFGRSDMVSIESQAKNDKVQALIPSSQYEIWVGLKQKAGEQWKYEWTSGVEVTAVAGELMYAGDDEKPYRNWINPEQIDDGNHDGEDCFTLLRSHGKWADWVCGNSLLTVCEFIP